MKLQTLKKVSLERKVKRRKPQKIRFTGDILPLGRVYEGNVFSLEDGSFFKTFRLKNINYKILSKEKRENRLIKWGEVLNTLEPGTLYKYTIIKRKVDDKEFRSKRLMPMKGDGLDKYREEYNHNLSTKNEKSSKISEEHFFQINTIQKDDESARMYLNRCRRDLSKELTGIGSGLTEVSRNEYLEVLYDFLNMGDVEFFSELDADAFLKSKHGLNDLIAPQKFKVNPFDDYMIVDGMYMRAFYIPPSGFANYIKDDIVFDLTEKDRHMAISVDIVPIPTDEAQAMVEKFAMKVEDNITKFEDSQNKHGNFHAQLPFRLRKDRANEEEWNTDLHERDQRLFLTLVTVVLAAESLDQLKTESDELKASARKNGCKLESLTHQQQDGLITALPFGINKFLTERGEKLRTLTTEGLSSFIPFSVQELSHDNGAYYGQNAISGRCMYINRKKGMNGNCMIYGGSGSGKSFRKKQEQIYNILNSEDKLIIIDPEREYSKLVEAVGGQVIKLSAGSDNHINALELEKEYGENKNPIVMKSEFMMSLYAAIRGKDAIDSGEKTIIDACVREAYKEYIASGYKGNPPTLIDFVQALKEYNHPIAEKMVLDFGIFTTGSLDTFAYQTNVLLDNRIVCFDTYELGDHLQPVGMLVIMDYILNTLIKNRAEGKWTYVDVDEIYLLYLYEITSNFFFRLAKRIRKYNGLLTGITQSLEDAIKSTTGRAMMANSDFCIFLSLTAEEAKDVAEILNLTEEQLAYVTEVGKGKGIIKLGSNIIPFEDDFPENTELFKLITTKQMS